MDRDADMLGPAPASSGGGGGGGGGSGGGWGGGGVMGSCVASRNPLLGVPGAAAAPENCAPYVRAIVDYWNSLERSQPVSGITIIEIEPPGTMGNRAVLVDWLVEVSEEFRLAPEVCVLMRAWITPFMCAVSRHCTRRSTTSIGRSCACRLQLLDCNCLVALRCS